jgi:hypothetical protein
MSSGHRFIPDLSRLSRLTRLFRPVESAVSLAVCVHRATSAHFSRLAPNQTLVSSTLAPGFNLKLFKTAASGYKRTCKLVASYIQSFRNTQTQFSMHKY